MEAKDTVMSPAQIDVAYESWCDYNDFYARKGAIEVAKVQAEISFDRGKQVGFEIGIEQGKAEGRREVVELLDVYENQKGYCAISNHIPYSQLEAWGIKGD